ncbi:MAG TPA: anti-sigma factor [Acidimicrobiia bacterium]|nr:anti-sigma factor [Acidimicrobiia bacterium]
MSNHEIMDLVPLYALDALEGQEQADFVEHLETCSQCLSALDDYQDVAANLVHDQPASEEIWERISSAISTDGATESKVVPLARPRPNMFWRWTTAVAAVFALVFGAIVIIDNLDDQGLTSHSIAAAASRVVDQPGTLVGDFFVNEVSVAQVILAGDGRGFVIPTESLDPLDESRTYQLWVINDAEDAISAGVLGNRPEPSTFTWTGKVTGFALTREVAGGVVSSAGDVVAVITEA